ncbi:hypothetical protein SBF1_4920002 [Candidatus Desulfosporosinus infrequens]|uniref:Uncharacterized protein n=1 Tax=Candidatus Desulfosporosinus infrequens TaxID=2043169 RepID=A0A2U3LGH7_9FIRM|nr:hypothetical protein SBF1_4920002 [Candidatus Desulfosporosinus infrequens]
MYILVQCNRRSHVLSFGLLSETVGAFFSYLTVHDLDRITDAKA